MWDFAIDKAIKLLWIVSGSCPYEITPSLFYNDAFALHLNVEYRGWYKSPPYTLVLYHPACSWIVHPTTDSEREPGQHDVWEVGMTKALSNFLKMFPKGWTLKLILKDSRRERVIFQNSRSGQAVADVLLAVTRSENPNRPFIPPELLRKITCRSLLGQAEYWFHKTKRNVVTYVNNHL